MGYDYHIYPFYSDLFRNNSPGLPAVKSLTPDTKRVLDNAKIGRDDAS